MPERIGRYDLVKTLNEGDRGKLYLARQTGFGGFQRHVVIKTFEQLPGAAEGPFIEETLDLGRLHHQHITPVLDVGRDGDRFYVALDFVHGRSAREVWQQTFTLGALLPLDFALTVVVAVAAGLHYAHTRRRADGSPLGLLHGHVSLSNVLIGFDGSVQLIGFAGASARGLRASETQLGFSKDQLAYLSPEQARRQGQDVRSDVFALGTILYELTTMRRAFRDDSDRLTIERVKIGSYVQPSKVVPDFPLDLERVIKRALDIDPEARYPNAEMMRREILAVGHNHDFVLGDAAIVEVMAQLFEDSAVDPWTDAHADVAPDALAVDEVPRASRKKLRAATETVDALAIELEIPVEEVARAATTTTPEGQPLRPTPPPADDFSTTTPVPAIRDMRPSDTLGSTGSVPVLAPLTAPPLEERAPSPVAGIADALEPDASKSMSDTDGVPVVDRLPVKPDEPEPRARAKAVAPPAPRRGVDFKIVGLIGAVAAIAITTTIVFAMRSCSSTEKPQAIDATPIIAIDAMLADAAVVVPAIDAAPPDASTTVRLEITSTPPGATLVLDGTKLGKTPFVGELPRATDGKPHVLKVRLGGYNTVRQDVDLTTDLRYDAVLKKAAATPSEDGSGAKTESGAPIELEVPD